MSDNRSFERAMHEWLDAGSDWTPPAAIDAVLLAVRTTPQERDFAVPWRNRAMPASLRLAAVIAIVAVAGAAALMLYRAPGVGTAPTPSPSTSTTPTPAPPVTFTSDRFGYSISLPGDFLEASPVDDLPDGLYPGDEAQYADRFDAPVNRRPWLVVAVIDLPAGQSAGEFEASFDAALGSCQIHDRGSTTVEGVEARTQTVDCPGFSWYEVRFERVGQFWDIQWADSAANLEAGRPTFERVLDSFRFTN